MKVQNMESSRGNKVANQFIVSDCEVWIEQTLTTGDMFQSYETNIAFRSDQIEQGKRGQIYLNEGYWDYSVTTGKYRNQFLGETKKETQKKIDSGEYKLVNLN